MPRFVDDEVETKLAGVVADLEAVLDRRVTTPRVFAALPLLESLA